MFRQAISANPRDARLHLGAGAAAYLQRRDEEARAALERALQLNPALGLARELLGLVLYRSGQLDAAVAAYETLIAANPPSRRSPIAWLAGDGKSRCGIA